MYWGPFTCLKSHDFLSLSVLPSARRLNVNELLKQTCKAVYVTHTLCHCWHTEGRNTHECAVIEPVCCICAQCVIDLIWGVCQCWYALFNFYWAKLQPETSAITPSFTTWQDIKKWSWCTGLTQAQSRTIMGLTASSFSLPSDIILCDSCLAINSTVGLQLHNQF